MERVLVQYSEELLAQIDAARGDTPRSAWIRRACENRLNGSRIESVEGSPAAREIFAGLQELHSIQKGLDEAPEPKGKGKAKVTPLRAKACAHPETIFKMGARYCVKCGEFV